MSEESERKVLDSEKAKLHMSGGVLKQRIPAKWRKLQGLRTFFEGDLEINLITEHGETIIEIRRAHKP